MIGDVPDTPQPWSRITDRTPMPTPLTEEAIQRLDQGTFRQLVRDHLMPYDDSDPARGRWQTLWRHLRSATLQERTLNVLEDYLDQVNAYLQEDPGDRRALQFQKRCEGFWNRLTTPQAVTLPVRYGALVAAVRAHRAEVLASGGVPRQADITLWRRMRRDGDADS